MRDLDVTKRHFLCLACYIGIVIPHQLQLHKLP